MKRILVTAVAPSVPPQLLSQLKIGGILVMPVGEVGGNQELVVVSRNKKDSINYKEVLPVRFVPFTGKGVLTLRER